MPAQKQRKHDPNVPLRAAIYARVSIDRSQNRASVSEQVEACQKVVARNGYNLVGIYSDNDQSASPYSKDGERIDWNNVVKLIRAGEIDVLVIFEYSRATRDDAVWSILLQFCRLQNVLICAGGKVQDPVDPTDALTLGVAGLMAAYEAHLISERVKRAHAARAVLGSPGSGKPPFGYKRVYNGVGELVRQEIDRDERVTIGTDGKEYRWTPAGIMEMLFAEILRGTSRYRLAQKLNAMGIPNPRTFFAKEKNPERILKYTSNWNPAAISTMVKNNSYLGHRYHLQVLTATDAWPALISEADYKSITSIFGKKVFPGKTERPALSKHLLSRYAVCGACQLSVQITSGPAYRCRTGHCYIRSDEADRFVVAWTLDRLSDKSFREALSRHSSDDARIVELKNKRLVHQQAVDDANAAYLDPNNQVPHAILNKKLEIENPILAQIDREINSLTVPDELLELLAGEPVTVWRNMDLQAQRRALKCLASVTMIPIGRGGKAPIEARIAVDYSERIKAKVGII